MRPIEDNAPALIRCGVLRPILLALPLTCAACGSPPAPTQKVNLELKGSSSCLGLVVGTTNVGFTKLPEWEGGIGTLHIGPIPTTEVDRVRALVRQFPCVLQMTKMPCRSWDEHIVSCE
jgi:hypothetical protein